jgi:hypothetical protein
MKNILDNIQAGYRLYDIHYQFIGKTGEFKMLNTDGSIKWKQLIVDTGHIWVHGNIIKSYKRGFIIDNLVIKKTKNLMKKS